MHQLQRRGTRARSGELGADIVFDRLDVMVDARLDQLDGRGGGCSGRLGQVLRAFTYRGSKLRAGQLRRGGRDMQQPARFDADALADESALGKQHPQRRGGRAIAAVKRRQRVDCGERITLGRGVARARGHALLRTSKC